jgi:hypothetical protein
MLVSVLVVVAKLLYGFFNATSSPGANDGTALAAAPSAGSKTELFASSSFQVAFVGVMDIVFTFGGQVRWWEAERWACEPCIRRHRPARGDASPPAARCQPPCPTPPPTPPPPPPPQVNWLRYITTMRRRDQFVNAVSVTTSFMTVMYLLVGVVRGAEARRGEARRGALGGRCCRCGLASPCTEPPSGIRVAVPASSFGCRAPIRAAGALPAHAPL